MIECSDLDRVVPVQSGEHWIIRYAERTDVERLGGMGSRGRRSPITFENFWYWTNEKKWSDKIEDGAKYDSKEMAESWILEDFYK